MKLTRLADTTFLERKRSEREGVINKGLFIEEIESKGKTPEDLKKEAREVLEVGDDGIIKMEYESILKKQNVEAQAFISVVNSISKLEATGILDGKEIKILRESEKKLAEKLAVRYNVDVERLYVEEKLGEE